MSHAGLRGVLAAVVASWAVVGADSPARAGFTVDVQSVAPITSGPDAGDYLWTYNVSIAASDSVVASPGGTSFVQVFDFAGYVPGSISAPSGWSASAPLLMPPPPPANVILLHGDNPSVPNLLFRYTSGPTLNGATLANSVIPGTFSAVSVYPELGAVKDFVGQLGVTSTGSLVGSGGDILVPVPEPIAMISTAIGLGLLGLGFARRLRSKPA